MSKADQSKLQA